MWHIARKNRSSSRLPYARTAPTLIMGDVSDPNVPLVISYEWYPALRGSGVPVGFYAYPVDTHFPKDIVRTTDVYRRWVGWPLGGLDDAIPEVGKPAARASAAHPGLCRQRCR
jgi:dipeptidyl aminopeptidase/acylaminoacyl peptidase